MKVGWMNEVFEGQWKGGKPVSVGLFYRRNPDRKEVGERRRGRITPRRDDSIFIRVNAKEKQFFQRPIRTEVNRLCKLTKNNQDRN